MDVGSVISLKCIQTQYDMTSQIELRINDGEITAVVTKWAVKWHGLIWIFHNSSTREFICSDNADLLQKGIAHFL